MQEPDFEHYRRRLHQERKAAATAVSPAAAEAHRRMADRYALLVAPDAEQRGAA